MIVCRIGFPGERKHKRIKIDQPQPKHRKVCTYSVKQHFILPSPQLLQMTFAVLSKDLADCSSLHCTATWRQTPQPPFPSISDPSPTYMAFFVPLPLAVFHPFAKTQVRDQHRGFKECFLYFIILLLLSNTIQGIPIRIRASASHRTCLLKTLQTAITCRITPVMLFPLKHTYIGPAGSSSAAGVQVQSRGRQRKERRESQCLYHTPAELQTANQSIYSIKGHSAQ